MVSNLTFASFGNVSIKRFKGMNLDSLLHFGKASFHLPGKKQFVRTHQQVRVVKMLNCSPIILF